MGRSVLSSGELGQHNGLPCTIVVSTTLQDLESGAGYAVTGGGTLLPMSDVIRLASHSHHYLVIFDKHTNEPLYLGRSKRIASAGQRVVLHAQDRGCSFPGVPSRRTAAKCTTQNWIGPMADKPTSPRNAWPVGRTTAWSNPAAGAPENAKTAAPNGSRRRIWTQAKAG
jgi:Domain of unknown function (DUF222)